MLASDFSTWFWLLLISLLLHMFHTLPVTKWHPAGRTQKWSRIFHTAVKINKMMFYYETSSNLLLLGFLIGVQLTSKQTAKTQTSKTQTLKTLTSKRSLLLEKPQGSWCCSCVNNSLRVFPWSWHARHAVCIYIEICQQNCHKLSQ